jgi:hypothetical protein
MSLEIAIQENTAAVKALTEALKGFSVTTNAAPAAPAAEEPKPAKVKTPKAEKPVETPAQAAAMDAHVAAVTKIELGQLQELGKKLIDAGKQAELKALVTKLGSAKLSLLPVEKYAEALAELTALTAEDSSL